MPAWSGSTPILWGEKIFLNVADGDYLYLWCVDRNTGKPLWKRQLGGGNEKMRKQNMSSPSPVTDGENVYVITGKGSLKGFDLNGNELWAREIQQDYGEFGLNWGYASSPLLYEDSLFVPVLHGMKTDEPSYILRIDKKRGKRSGDRSARRMPSPNHPILTLPLPCSNTAVKRRSSSRAGTASPGMIRPPEKNCGG